MFWQSTIINHCKQNKLLVFNFKDLHRMMAVNSRLPQCLDVVIHHMLKEGTLKTLSDFKLSHNPSWLAWTGKKLLLKPLQWSYNRLFKTPLVSTYNWLTDNYTYNFNLYASQQLQLPDDDIAIPQLITSRADDIYNKHVQQLSLDFTDNIINYHLFRRRCEDIVVDEGWFELCMMDLSSRGKCRVVLNADGEKFLVMTDDKTASSAMVGDEAKIYRLKMMEFKLEKDIDKLECQINQCKASAKDLIKQGKKKMALTLLKKKRNLEDLMEKKHSSMENVSGLLSMIQQTEHNKQVYEAFSSGVQAFKGMRAKAGLSEERVDEIMMDVQESLEQNEEINQSISRPTVDGWCDEELEKELDDIINQQEASKQQQDLSSLLDLPSLPTHLPGTSPPSKSTNKRSERSF